jgi:hypothetical protein
MDRSSREKSGLARCRVLCQSMGFVLSVSLSFVLVCAIVADRK